MGAELVVVSAPVEKAPDFSEARHGHGVDHGGNMPTGTNQM